MLMLGTEMDINISCIFVEVINLSSYAQVSGCGTLSTVIFLSICFSQYYFVFHPFDL
jgi:hypothetical protein